MDKKRMIKVYKTIKSTNYLKSTNEKELLKIKQRDEGVLSLIANSRLYPKEYEYSHRIDLSFNQLKHSDFYLDFKIKMHIFDQSVGADHHLPVLKQVLGKQGTVISDTRKKVRGAMIRISQVVDQFPFSGNHFDSVARLRDRSAPRCMAE